MSTETTRVPQQKDSAAAAVTEPVLSGPTMIRWSSDPASLSSSSSSGNSTVAGNTVNSARCAIIALQREVNIARERCRKLEIDLAAERDSSSASLSAIVQCVEQKQAENLQLQATVWKQRKHILKLRRQLLAAGTQLSGASVHAIPSEDSLLDLDNDFSDSELGLVNVPCISQENQRRAVTSSWGEPTDMSTQDCLQGARSHSVGGAVSRSKTHQQLFHRQPMEHKVMQTIYGDVVDRFQDSSAPSPPFSVTNFELEKHVLKQRLSDTIAICQQLARSLDARNRNVRVSSSAACAEIASSVGVHPHPQQIHNPCSGHSEVAELENALTCTRSLMEDDRCREQVAELEARLMEMEHANEEWQRYAEQRDQYVRVLAQRCGELGLALNSSKRPASDSKLSAEQQTKIDRLLLDQRRKMELVQEAKNQADKENQRLKGVIEQMTYEKQNVDDRLRQAVTRLKSSEAQRIEALERIQVLETQLSLYVEDFNVEQRERRLSQERTLAAERQLEAALLRLRQYESSSGELPHPSFAGCRSSSNDSLFRLPNIDGGPPDSSIPLLVARGTVAQVTDDSNSRSGPSQQPQPPPQNTD